MKRESELLLLSFGGKEIAEGKQGIGEMHILDNNAAVTRVYFNIGEVPDGLDAAGDEQIGNVLGAVAVYGENGDVNIVFPDKSVLSFGVHDGNTGDLLADELLADLKSAEEAKIIFSEVYIFDKGLAYLACAHKNNGVSSVNAEYGGNVGAESLYIVAVALLAEFAEAGEVLTDLGRSKTHLGAKLTGGNALNVFLNKLVQLSQIARQTADNIFGYVCLFHKRNYTPKLVYTRIQIETCSYFFILIIAPRFISRKGIEMAIVIIILYSSIKRDFSGKDKLCAGAGGDQQNLCPAQ